MIKGGIITVVADNDVQLSGSMEAEGGTININTPTTICIKEVLELIGDVNMQTGTINIQANVNSTGGTLTLTAVNIICSNNSNIHADSLNIMASTITGLGRPRRQLKEKSCHLASVNRCAASWPGWAARPPATGKAAGCGETPNVAWNNRADARPARRAGAGAV